MEIVGDGPNSSNSSTDGPADGPAGSGFNLNVSSMQSPRPRSVLSDYIIGHIRTLTPIAVGYLVTLLARQFNIVVSDSTSASVIIAMSNGLSALYYVAARWLGRRYPWAERMLGVAATPLYGDVADS